MPLDLENLLSGTAEDREEVSLSELGQSAWKNLTEIRRLLDAELKAVTVEAMKFGDLFWQYRKEMLDCPDETQRPVYGTRARLRGNTFSAVWYKNAFRKMSDGTKRVYSNEIPKGKGARYPMSRFNRAGEQELAIINEVESRYELLRLRASALRKARAALAEYERVLTLSYPSTEEG